LQVALQFKHGQFGLCFAAGGRDRAVIKLLYPGDEVLAANDMYGGTYRCLQRFLKNMACSSSFQSAG